MANSLSACRENHQAQGEGQGEQQEEMGQEDQGPGNHVFLIAVFHCVFQILVWSFRCISNTESLYVTCRSADEAGSGARGEEGCQHFQEEQQVWHVALSFTAGLAFASIIIATLLRLPHTRRSMVKTKKKKSWAHQ
jgi:hypothetical protein